MNNFIANIWNCICRFFNCNAKHRGKNGGATSVLSGAEISSPAANSETAESAAQTESSPPQTNVQIRDFAPQESPRENGEKSEPPPRNTNSEATDPAKISGQRTDDKLKPRTNVGETSPPPADEKYEIVCREKAGRLQIIFRQLAAESESFSQSGAPLNFNNHGECALPDFRTAVHFANGETIALFDGKNPLLFRCRREWRGDGKSAACLSADGYFIAIAPQEWKREMQNPGSGPQPCEDETFQAHFIAPGECAHIHNWHPHSAISVSVDGKVAHDDSGKGDLFVGAPPQLRDAEDWKNVSWVRVGEEGRGKWGENFRPRDKTLAEVLQGRGGWFYVRIYDNNGKRADSFDFRFSAKLRTVRIHGEEYSSQTLLVPEKTGHAKTQVCFVDANENNLHPVLRIPNGHAAVREDGVIFAAAHPDGDDMRWTLPASEEPRGSGVDVDIVLPRVWWRLGGGEWRDKPLTMARKEFYDRRDERVEVCIPARIQFIRAGMNDGAKQKFPGKRVAENAHRNRAEFALRQFADGVRRSSAAMDLQIQCGDRGDKIFSIIRVPKDPPPETKSAPEVPPMQSSENRFAPPTAQVKSSAGWRRGAGFSAEELQRAGLTAADARRKGLSADLRRTTAHCDNIGRLKTFLNSEECHADRTGN